MAKTLKVVDAVVIAVGLSGPILARELTEAGLQVVTYPDRPVTGRVASIGWGIYQDDGASGPDLLPKVKPTFEWIRLAQRVPVRVHLDSIPDGVELRVGTTASVLVMTGDADPQAAPPAPALLR